MKKKDKQKPSGFLRHLSFLVVGGLMGIPIGIGSVVFIDNSMPDELKPFHPVIALGSFLISIFLHLLIHEGGHYLFGKVSGYDFASFRVGNIIFIRENGKLIRKKFNIIGTGGQCLMVPPELVNGLYPYVLYNLGGSIMNFVFSGIFLALCFALPSLLTILLAGPFVMIGIFLGLINILPLKINGIATDGYNAFTLGKKEAARHAFWLTLRINALSVSGVRYRDMPTEWFELPHETDVNDPLAVTHAMVRFGYLLDTLRFDEAKELGKRLLNTADRMLEIHRNDLRCELLFLEIIGGGQSDEIERLYTVPLKKYIKATSLYVSRPRLLYAYARLVSLDTTEAEKLKKQFEKACATYPNAGEISSERDMMTVIDRAAEKKPTSAPAD